MPKEWLFSHKKSWDKKIYNKIVMIERADPGYDYLFTYSILGLITKYGGANSHMAIRCAELSIPAVIGCGEIMFERYSNSTIINIDSSNKLIKIIMQQLCHRE